MQFHSQSVLEAGAQAASPSGLRASADVCTPSPPVSPKLLSACRAPVIPRTTPGSGLAEKVALCSCP